MKRNAKYLATVGLIAAIYTALTIVLAPISYGPIQVRVADALGVLCYLGTAPIWGFVIGGVVANVYGGLGWIDIVVGGIVCQLLSGVLTYWLRRFNKPWLAPLPTILVTGLVVGGYLSILFKVPTWYSITTVTIGEIISVGLLGYPLLVALLRRGVKLD